MRRNPDGFIWVVSWILFISCSIGLFSLGYECIQKYLESPQTVDISTHGQSELDLPVFTLCPRSSEHGEADPPPLNITNLEQCGLTYEMLLNGNFRGSGISACEDPDEFWNHVHLKPKDFGIKHIGIYFIDTEAHFISVDEEDPAWEKKLVLNGAKWSFKTCFTMNLPKQSSIIKDIDIGVKKDKSFELYIHSSGLLNHIPLTSMEHKMVVFDSNKGSSIDIMYSQLIWLPLNETAKCNPFQNFSASRDMTLRMEQV